MSTELKVNTRIDEIKSHLTRIQIDISQGMVTLDVTTALIASLANIDNLTTEIEENYGPKDLIQEPYEILHNVQEGTSGLPEKEVHVVRAQTTYTYDEIKEILETKDLKIFKGSELFDEDQESWIMAGEQIVNLESDLSLVNEFGSTRKSKISAFDLFIITPEL